MVNFWFHFPEYVEENSGQRVELAGCSQAGHRGQPGQVPQPWLLNKMLAQNPVRSR